MILSIQTGVMTGRAMQTGGGGGIPTVRGMGSWPGPRWAARDGRNRRRRGPWGVAGVGEFTAVVNGDVMTYADQPCADGLTFINGGCYRTSGTQETPYGTVSIPLAGPDSNLATAQSLLGSGYTCKTELVGVGPYAYEQNVCRDASGAFIGSADLIAETAYVQQNLATLAQPTGTVAPAPIFATSQGIVTGVVAPTSPTVATSTAPTASTPQVIQTATPGGAAGGGGGGVTPTTGTPTAIQTATGPGAAGTFGANSTGVTVGGVSLPWLWLGLGVAALVVVPMMAGGRR